MKAFSGEEVSPGALAKGGWRRYTTSTPNESYFYGSEKLAMLTIPNPVTTKTPFTYIRRHWKGQLSLAKSFWVNGFLLYSIISVFLISAVLNIDVSKSPAMSIWIFSLPVYVWQAVGIWRAADNYRIIKNKADIPWYTYSASTRWDRAAKYVVVLGILKIFSDYNSVGLS